MRDRIDIWRTPSQKAIRLLVLDPCMANCRWGNVRPSIARLVTAFVCRGSWISIKSSSNLVVAKLLRGAQWCVYTRLTNRFVFIVTSCLVTVWMRNYTHVRIVLRGLSCSVRTACMLVHIQNSTVHMMTCTQIRILIMLTSYISLCIICMNKSPCDNHASLQCPSLLIQAMWQASLWWCYSSS
jgi:hypothetical protein